MRRVMQPLVCLPLLLQLVRGMETAYSKVSRRDARWMISPLSHIYYPNLGTVRARLCGLHSPQIARPTDRPRFSSHADRAIACNRTASHLIPYRDRFLFFLPLPFPAPNTIRSRGQRSNNNNNDCNARRRVMVCTDRITSKRNAKLSKNCVPRWTGSLFNLRSRHAAILENLHVLAHYPCNKTSGTRRKSSYLAISVRDASFIIEIIDTLNKKISFHSKTF